MNKSKYTKSNSTRLYRKAKILLEEEEQKKEPESLLNHLGIPAVLSFRQNERMHEKVSNYILKDVLLELRHYQENLENLVASRTSELHRQKQQLENEISERKQTQKELLQSEARYQALAETADDSIFQISREMTVLFINPCGAKLFHADASTLIGQHLGELFPGQETVRMQDNLHKVFTTGEQVRIEGHFDYSGHTVCLDTKLVPLLDEQGDVVSVMGVSRDITERYQAEEVLRENLENYRTLFNATSEGMLIHQEGLLLEVNDAICGMFGYTREEVIGTLIVEHVDEAFVALIQEKISIGSEEPFEASGMHKEGQLLPLWVQAKRICYNKQDCFLAVVRLLSPR